MDLSIGALPRWLTVFFTWIALTAMAWATPAEPTLALEWDDVPLPGATVQGTALVTFAEGLYGYQNPPSSPELIPVELSASGGKLTAVKYPEGTMKVAGGATEPVALYRGTVRIPFTLAIPQDVPKQGITLTVSYQQCDDKMCFVPGEVSETILALNEGTQIPPPLGTVAVEPREPAQTPAPQRKGGLEGAVQWALDSKNWPALIGVLLAIGLAVNLTPCVYPLIGVTVGFFSGQATDNPRSRAGLGIMYVLGIATTFGFIGGLAAASGKAFGTLFAKPEFNIGLGIFMVVLALSMFDLYQIGLPPFISKHLQGRSGGVGAYLMGSLAGVGAAPCAGPLIIAVFTTAASLNNATLSVLMFLLVGLGVGIPYLFLVMAGNVKALPKAGGWMRTVKAILGLVVIYFGVDYLIRGFPALGAPGVAPWVWTGFFASCAVVLFLWDLHATDPRTANVKAAAILVAGILTGSSLNTANLATSPSLAGGASVAELKVWEPWTEQSWQAALASGKPILVDGTANWCSICKVIEANIFSKPSFREATSDFVRLKIDWSTGVPQEYIDLTSDKFDIKGLPYIGVFKPGGEAVVSLSGLDSLEQLKPHLEVARAR